ncbi:hypothetical protein MKX03_024662 [Papaver bracteatum]|nr:hypothetical protein MKX03_024662 [Papaver bracteatum]
MKRRNCESVMEMELGFELLFEVIEEMAAVSADAGGGDMRNGKNKSIQMMVVELIFKSIIAVLNKGLVANGEDMEKADDAAKELEDAGGTVGISEDQEKLQGRWKLVYRSGLSSRTLGGSRPRPPIGRLLPITLGQVFQIIDIFSKDFDNIVELQLGAPWPLPPIEATTTLEHKFELTGMLLKNCVICTIYGKIVTIVDKIDMCSRGLKWLE